MQKQKNSVKKNVNKRELQLFSMCFLPMLLVFIFNYLPMAGIIIAFKDYRYSTGVFGSRWVGLNNFKFFFKSTEFARITVNTLYLNALFILTGTVMSLLVAILLYQLTNRTAIKTIQTIFITPYFVSWVIASYMLYGFLNTRFGILNTWLEKFGANAVDWYSDPKPWPVIFVIVYLWKSIGMDSITYYAALMGIDSSLIEAGEIDGANNRQIIRHVIIPTMLPLVSILTILKIGNIFRADFGMFYQLPRDSGALYKTTDVVDTYIFRALREIGDMGMGSAVGLLQSAVGFVLVMVTNAISKKIDPDRALF